MGESAYAVGWTQRLVALRPGDRKAMAALLERVAGTRDGARFADALIWVLARPQPAAAIVELVVRPLRDLIAIDAARAVLVARRALDAFGARLPGPRDAIVAAADAAGDVALAVATLERAADVESGETRAALLSTLRERQQRAGDVDGEARTLLSIARTAPDDATFPALEALAQVALSPDGELARLEALAHLTASAESPMQSGGRRPSGPGDSSARRSGTSRGITRGRSARCGGPPGSTRTGASRRSSSISRSSAARSTPSTPSSRTSKRRRATHAPR